MRRLFFLMALALLTATTGVARAETIWATGGNGTTLVNINSANGAASTIGAAGVNGAYAATFDTNGDLYGIMNWATGNNRLGKYNKVTGAITAVSGNLFNNAFMLALEISSGGVMYGGSWGTSNNFFSINKTTGVATVIGSTGIDNVMDFAFDSSGNLWGTGSNLLYKINTTTGAASALVNIAGTAGEVMGIMFGNDGKLYATDYTNSSNLYTINTTTGAATFVGNTGLSFAHGGDIQFIQEVPVPSGIVLSSIGILGFGLITWLRRHKAELV